MKRGVIVGLMVLLMIGLIAATAVRTHGANGPASLPEQAVRPSRPSMPEQVPDHVSRPDRPPMPEESPVPDEASEEPEEPGEPEEPEEPEEPGEPATEEPAGAEPEELGTVDPGVQAEETTAAP